MLQRLGTPTVVTPLLQRYLDTLLMRGFQGEIHVDRSTRLINATDNSVYQIVPQAVLIPRTETDIVTLFKMACLKENRKLTFVARGGGTGTNGQSLNDSIIIDCSKYLNQIIELNLEDGWVKVQPGVVLDQLNEYLRPHGVFFAPTVSPSNRATLGGMVNTDASGKGSLIYGKTSEHVMAITAVYADGSLHTSFPVNQDDLAALKAQQNFIGHIYREVDDAVRLHREVIKQQFPKLTRFMTGYNLAHVYPDEAEVFNLNAILTGSEGTLGVVTEIKLKLTKLPAFKRLFVLQYTDFYDALHDAEFLVNSQPHAIETIDAMILSLAKTDVTYPLIARFLETKGQQTGAINLVEFLGEDENELEEKIKKTESHWQKKSPIAFAYTLVRSPEDISKLWDLRKKCVGLLGKEPGARKPVSGVEDTLVPPSKLVEYVKEFRALLDAAGLTYGMFGHIDVGCLHVRPSLDLSNPHDEMLYHQLLDQVADLTKKYGGLMWGEHGKGFRSQYVELFFGPVLYPVLRRIKAAFDPFNQLNPGKIATPISSNERVVSITADKRGTFERQITPALRSEYEHAIACNGNGACFNYNVQDVMCPSYKATRDRRHSPKGRAALLREWVRLISTQKKGLNTPRWLNSLFKKCKQYDFSHEVHEALAGCLGCKACVSQCPVNVDIPTMKSSFLSAYYSRYLRPIRDYFVAYSEQVMCFSANYLPRTTNFMMHNSVAKFILKKIGLVDLPVLSWPSLKKQCHAHNISILYINNLETMTFDLQNSVVIVQDWLTSCYQAELVIDYYLFLQKCGYKVYLLEALAHGKTWHALGFLEKFYQIAKKNSA